MSLLYISLLFIIAGLATADRACDRKVARNCDSSDLPQSFPENEEELNDGCRGVIRFVECGLDVMEDCKNSEEEARQINDMLSVVRHVCDEDSRIHRVIAGNLQCVKPIVMRESHVCFTVPLNEEKLAKHLDILSDQSLQPFAEGGYICGMVLYSAACVGLQIQKKCGSSALDAYIEIAQQFSPAVVDGCNDEIKELLPAYIEILMLEEAEAEEIGAAFRRKKK